MQCVANVRVVDELEETNTPVLATVGIISPYIGLYSVTVWGMPALIHQRSFSKTKQHSFSLLETAEALIAT
ncbi:MotA/TolQ/ExbB proton channel family protein [Vibrio chagasii]|nr:MotA/TolQ/ExbB proton channel family protein [Vibrio chagasii]